MDLSRYFSFSSSKTFFPVSVRRTQGVSSWESHLVDLRKPWLRNFDNICITSFQMSFFSKLMISNLEKNCTLLVLEMPSTFLSIVHSKMNNWIHIAGNGLMTCHRAWWKLGNLDRRLQSSFSRMWGSGCLIWMRIWEPDFIQRQSQSLEPCRQFSQRCYPMVGQRGRTWYRPMLNLSQDTRTEWVGLRWRVEKRVSLWGWNLAIWGDKWWELMGGCG